jgi:hypothetical protein
MLVLRGSVSVADTSITGRTPMRRPMTQSAWWALGLLAATVPVLVLIAVVEVIAGAMNGHGDAANADGCRAQVAELRILRCRRGAAIASPWSDCARRRALARSL